MPRNVANRQFRHEANHRPRAPSYTMTLANINRAERRSPPVRRAVDIVDIIGDRSDSFAHVGRVGVHAVHGVLLSHRQPWRRYRRLLMLRLVQSVHNDRSPAT